MVATGSAHRLRIPHQAAAGPARSTATSASVLIAAPARLGRRVVDLLIALASMIVSAGWWIAAVMLTPVGSRPFIGGSQHDGILELALGYNGFGRLTGDGDRQRRCIGVGPHGSHTDVRRSDRRSNRVAHACRVALHGRRLVDDRAASPRTDSTRASIIVWGGWLVVTAAVFSLMKGIFHQDYTVDSRRRSPRSSGIGAHRVWQHRQSLFARLVGAAAILGTVFSVIGPALARSRLERVAATGHHRLAQHHVGGDVARAGSLGEGLRGRGDRRRGRLALGIDRMGRADCCDTARGLDRHRWARRARWSRRLRPRAVPRWQSPRRESRAASREAALDRRRDRCLEPEPSDQPPTARCSAEASVAPPLEACRARPCPSTALVQTLLAGSDQYEWVAATLGSDPASGYQLATQKPVMPIGGFNGSDPSPTLAQFEQYVAEGKIHYFIPSGGFGRQNGGATKPARSPAGLRRTSVRRRSTA